MAYKALYRVFRPQSFSQVVGQQHIVTVLKNQIQSGQISHAYLFTGSRGTGKTSVAKIFARAISCPNTKDGEACGSCELCQESLNETSVDIMEIDAASNNGVDEIRDLRDKVKFAPVHGKYKVYIIDEVHMLSAGAFNALLKTLEEPPEHAVFILATTEPQKLPATVISRCQRYDFHKISEEDMIGRLQEIAASMDGKVEDAALHLLCQYSGGGLRDAISLLDQCLVFGEGVVNEETVLELLGRSNESSLFHIGGALLGHDREAAVLAIDQAVEDGKDVSQLCTDLIEHFRHIMLLKVCGQPEKLVGVREVERYQKQAAEADINRVIRVIDGLCGCLLDMRYAGAPLVYLEMAAIQLCTPELSDDRFALLERLDRLEQGLPLKTQESPALSPKEGIKPAARNQEPEPAAEGENPVGESEPEREEPAAEEPSQTVPEPETAQEPERADHPFGQEDYGRLLKRVKQENKTLYIPLMDSRFVSAENGCLTIGYPNKDCQIAMQAVEKRKDELSAALAEMGFSKMQICVKINNVDSTQAVLNLFGEENVEIID